MVVYLWDESGYESFAILMLTLHFKIGENCATKKKVDIGDTLSWSYVSLSLLTAMCLTPQ